MPLTSDAYSAMFAPQTDEVYLFLAAIEYSGGTLYIVNNSENVTSNGQEYTAYPFEVRPPDEGGSGSSRARMTVCNVDRELVPFIRTQKGLPTLTLSVILASDPDSIQWGPMTFLGTDISYNADTVTIQWDTDRFAREPYPGDRISALTFPGLFQGETDNE